MMPKGLDNCVERVEDLGVGMDLLIGCAGG